MIPKQIFFIWLGDNKPDYVNFAVKTFKEVNPDFKIDLIEEKDVENCNDEVIKKSYLEAEYEITKSLNKRMDECKKSFIYMKTSNHLRFNLLKKYGGIFLDADTFPIKPFDKKLLESNFRVTRSYNNDEFIFEEIFFIGQEKGNFVNPRLLYPCDAYNNEKFIQLKPKFFDCTLRYGEYFGNPKYNYIDHYNHYSWN